MNGAGSKPLPLSSPVQELLRKCTTWFDSTHATMTVELTSRNTTVPMPLATFSATRSRKLLPPA